MRQRVRNCRPNRLHATLAYLRLRHEECETVQVIASYYMVCYRIISYHTCHHEVVRHCTPLFPLPLPIIQLWPDSSSGLPLVQNPLICPLSVAEAGHGGVDAYHHIRVYLHSFPRPYHCDICSRGRLDRLEVVSGAGHPYEPNLAVEIEVRRSRCVAL